MNPVQEITFKLSSLCVYRDILECPAPKAFHHLLIAAGQAQTHPLEFYQAWGDFFAQLCRQPPMDSLAGCLTQSALYDENIFSISSAAGEPVSPAIRAAVQRDLSIILQASAITPEQLWEASGLSALGFPFDLPSWAPGSPVEPLQGEISRCLDTLAAYYRKHGCGIYARYRAFIWRNREIQPVSYPDTTSLKDLKGYEYPRSLVVDNTLSFLNGLPANNCLLYGDRGTGKSSTVKAILNEYYDKGLRVIEMPKEYLMDFPYLVNQIAALPMKFIIFIDDLSFSKQDDTYASLKAVLEGGVAARPANTLIYATSNRRHLLRETFSDREGDEVHRGDTIQESLSLADRFGLSVSFSQPDKAHFLEIVRQLALQQELGDSLPELEKGAEQWALQRGGRSPRCARQYINACEAKIKLGHPLA